jgi:hypothetical protein
MKAPARRIIGETADATTREQLSLAVFQDFPEDRAGILLDM